jgi:nitrate/TMAO reductase-like tetraheme cytochrome c subunit
MSTVPARPRRRRLVVALVVLGGLIVAGVVGAAGFMKVTATSQFCSSCHIMLPYVEAWKQSRHAAVECVQCHYPPDFKDAMWVKFQAVTQLAKWATQTYNSKPFADVRDVSCLRSGCHARDALGTGTTKTFARTVRFDHARHLDPGKTGQALRCTTCHAQAVVDRHFEVSETVCFSCHMKGAKGERELTPRGGCTSCHQAPTGEIPGKGFDHKEMVARGVACHSCHANVVTGRGDAPPERCIGCHNERDKLDRFADVKLLHDAHVTKSSIECTRCHGEIVHRRPRTASGT